MVVGEPRFLYVASLTPLILSAALLTPLASLTPLILSGPLCFIYL